MQTRAFLLGLGLLAALHLGEELEARAPGPGLYLMSAVVLLTVFGWLLARRWQTLPGTSHVIAAGVVTCAAEMYLHGSEGAQVSVAWFALAPLVVGAQGSMRAGLAWIAVSGTAWAGTARLQELGMLWDAPPIDSSGVLPWAARILPMAAAMLILYGQWARTERLRAALRDAEQRAAAEARETRTVAKALREEQRLRGSLLGSLDHGHRTPLTGMLGMTGLLLQTRLDAEQRRMVEDLRLAATLLRAGVDQLGDLARLASGELQFEQRPFDLHEVIAEAAQTWAERAQAQGSEIFVQLHEGTPRYLSGDAARIRRVLEGLIHRAVEATEDGEVQLHVEPVAIGKGRAALRFMVEDGARTMPAEEQTAVFEALLHGDAAGAMEGTSGQAGLALCSGFANAMDGETGFRAAGDGRGTRLWVTLPLPAVTDGCPQGLFTADFGGLRALVVHGRTKPRRNIVEQLRAIGLSAVEADSCPEALNMLELASDGLRPFDLALVDEGSLEMPLAAFRERIVERPQLARTGVVLLTHCVEPEQCQRFQEAGLPTFLTKPVLPSALKDTVALVVGLRAQAEDAA